MKNYRRVITLLLVLAMLLSLCACGTTKEEDASAAPQVDSEDLEQQELDVSNEELYDRSWKDEEYSTNTFSDELSAEGKITQPYDITHPEEIENGEVEFSTDRIMIKFGSGFDGEVDKDLKTAGVEKLELMFKLEQSAWYVGYIAKSAEVKTVLEKVRALDKVLVAEYDFMYEAASIIDSEEISPTVSANGNAADQWYLKSCGIQQAWEYQEENNLPVAGQGTVVAVIDTGVDYDHKDLAANMWKNLNEIPDNGIDDDNNGYVDDYYGVDVIAGEGNGDDDHGHGTHVAGIIAGVNNKEGIVGVAYNAKIMAVKAGQSSGYFNQSDVAEAIIYAYEMGADVINMSFGGSASSIAVQDALELAYTRCVLIAAAGNDGAPNELYIGAFPSYPAAFTFVLGVMSVGSNGVESEFTNWDVRAYSGIEYEVYAPGENIYSTLPNDRYASWSGTSMAAPVAAAVAAMLRADFGDRNTYPTKYIYGQLAATGDITARSCHGSHNLPSVVNAYNALTVMPKPEVGVSDYRIFDSVELSPNNNGDGVIDAGETVALGFELRNRWGMSKNTVVTVDAVSAGGIACPYVSFSTSLEGEYSDSASVNYGSIGTYSTGDCGKIITDGEFAGWENPVYLTVSKDCPNDYIIALNVSVECGNALDENDNNVYSDGSKVNIAIRRGVLLPHVITEDTVLSAENYYILSGSLLIEENATVTVEAGTNIQFWSDDPNDAYAQTEITYISVRGKLLFEGTEDNHIKLFPSELRSHYRVELSSIEGGNLSMSYCDAVNFYGTVNYAYGCEFSQNYADCIWYRWLDGATVSENRYGQGRLYCFYSESCAFYKLWYYQLFGALFKDCVFVDCGFSMETSVNNNDNNFENCVFLGNNTKWNQQGRNKTSTLTLDPDRSGVLYTFRDDTTGSVYAVCRMHAIAYAAFGCDRIMQYYEEIAEEMGGHLACFETAEERQFIKSYLSQIGFGQNMLVGIVRDGDGGHTWINGEAIGDFIEFLNEDSEDYSQLPYATHYSGFLIGYGGNVNYALIEIPDDTFVSDIGMLRSELTIDTEESYKLSFSPTPYTADTSSFIYEVKDSSIVSVSADGTVTPLKTGSTEVYVYSADKSVYSILKVNVVEPVDLEEITLSANKTGLNVGDKIKLTAATAPADTTKLVSYQSSDDSIAAVNGDGVVTAVAAGTVTISALAKDGTVSDSIELTVSVPVESLTFKDNVYITALEDTDGIPALEVLPANATNMNLVWESSNPEVAYVDENGKLVKLKNGVATIRCTAEGTEIYDEILVSVCDISSDSYVKDVIPMRDSISDEYAVLMSDGSIWTIGGGNAYAQKLDLPKAVTMDAATNGSSWCFALIDTEGKLRIFQKYYYNPLYEVSYGDIDNVIKVDVCLFNSYSEPSIFALTSNGVLWVCGYNGKGQLGIGNYEAQDEWVQSPVTNVKDIVTSSYITAILANDGKLYVVDRTSTHLPQLVAENVDEIYRCGDADGSCVIVSGVRHILSGGSDGTIAMGDTFLKGSNFTMYIDGGRIYAKGYNGYGKLGVGSSDYVNDFAEVPDIDNAKAIFATLYNTFIVTDDGKLYGAGANTKYQLANFTTVDSNVFTRVYLGVEPNDHTFGCEGSNLEGDGEKTLSSPTLTVDFNEALVSGSDFGLIKVKNSSGTAVAIEKSIRLDKLYIRAIEGFETGETYTVTVPASALSTRFGDSSEELTLTFTYTGEKTAIDYGAAEDYPETTTAETLVNPNAEAESAMTVEEANTLLKKAYLAVPNVCFRGNAVLNRMTDDSLDTWLRIVAPTSSDYSAIGLSGNYWGTTNSKTIDRMLVDFNQFSTYADLIPEDYLTEAPEDVWPFVVDAGVMVDGKKVSTVGNEEVTFYVDFNRDMDTSIDLDFRFGSAYPYEDYQIEGEWITPRHWEGTTTLTTIIENGWQFISVNNGKAADAPMKLYRDWARFSFRIDTTAAMSMNMQAEARENGISLTWFQDDFDTLAGYNIYRSTSEDGFYQRINTSIIPADTKEFLDDTVEPGVVYYYNFTVVKTDLTESEPSGKITIMSRDNMAPNMYHTPVYQAFTNNSIVINAMVTDNISVQSVKLYYRITGTEEWTCVNMTPLNDKYSAVISANEVTLEGLEYYIVAFDGSNYTYRASKENPYSITVQLAIDENSKGDVDGNGVIDMMDALMLLQAVNDRLNLDAEQFARADINSDGELSAAEALRIMQYVSGKITSVLF